MKSKLVLVSLLTLLFFNSWAQGDLPKGSVMLGGNIGFSSNSTEQQSSQTQKATSFYISPAAGLAVRKNLFVGLNLGYSFTKNKSVNGSPSYLDSTRRHSYNYGVFVRRYKPLKHIFSIFLQGDLGGFNSHEKSITNSPVTQYDSKTFGVNASLSPGVSYGINSKLQIETGLNNIVALQYVENKAVTTAFTPNSSRSSSFNVSTSLSNFTSQLYVGFRLLLQKKNKPGASKEG